MLTRELREGRQFFGPKRQALLDVGFPQETRAVQRALRLRRVIAQAIALAGGVGKPPAPQP